MMLDKLDALSLLDYAATPGPWTADQRLGVVQVYDGQARGCLAEDRPVVYAVNGTWTADGWLLPDGAGENASLNAALRNIAPELLAVVRAVDAWRHKHKPEAWLDVFAGSAAYWSASTTTSIHGPIRGATCASTERARWDGDHPA